MKLFGTKIYLYYVQFKIKVEVGAFLIIGLVGIKVVFMRVHCMRVGVMLINVQLSPSGKGIQVQTYLFNRFHNQYNRAQPTLNKQACHSSSRSIKISVSSARIINSFVYQPVDARTLHLLVLWYPEPFLRFRTQKQTTLSLHGTSVCLPVRLSTSSCKQVDSFSPSVQFCCIYSEKMKMIPIQCIFTRPLQPFCIYSLYNNNVKKII